MSVCRRVAYAPLMDRDNGDAGAGGQPPPEAFPKGFLKGFVRVLSRLLRGLRERRNPAGESTFQQRFDPFVEFFEAGFAHDTLAFEEESRGFPDLQPLAGVFAVGRDQLFKNDLIFLSNSSNDASPLIISPLTKKVGVELTFSTSPAYFWSAVILSISAWSLRQSSTACWLKPACLPIRVRVSAVFFTTQSFCCLNRRSTTAKYFPGSSLAMQRASIAPATALTSSGHSRKT